MAARRTSNTPRRDDSKPRGGGKGGGLITGLFIGLVVGLIVAAGLAWYFNNRTAAFQQIETPHPVRDQAGKIHDSKTEPAVTTVPAEASAPPANAAPAVAEPGENSDQARAEAPAPPAVTETPPSVAKPRVDYTFYGILPGDKPAKPIPPPKSNDIWWLQVAALKNPLDADKLKARLTLLGLGVAMQKVEGAGGVALYRVRVGPYKREDDAFGDLDTLAANNFEPRLFKETLSPTAPATKPEKP